MLRSRIAALAALLLAAGPAAAHGSSKSLGNFFGGFLHPLIEPTHLLALLAFGLLVGQRGIDRTHPAALCFCAGAALGLAAAGLGFTPATDTPLLALAALLGVGVASAVRLPRAVVGVAGALAGVGIGLGSRPEFVEGGALVAALLGTGLGACAWTVNVAALVSAFKRPWLLILVRVAGSWLTASAVLVLSLWMAQPQRPQATLSPVLPPGSPIEAPATR